ncbi:MAG: hypothetical protein ABSF47_01755 [Minisyncoccia bacterium]|jgi:uncharacterized protein (UPF0333 family)
MTSRNGQVALSFILLVSGVIIEVVIAGSFVTYFLSSSGLGERLQSRAASAAYSGVSDALVKISRNRDFGASTQNYGLTVGSDSDTIGVSRTLNDSAGVYVYTITSLGMAGTREKNIVATAVVNQTTGQIQLQSVVDQSLQ